MGDMEVRYQMTLDGVDWVGMVQTLTDDQFHNGRTAEQMRLSCENSFMCVLAYVEQDLIGMMRVLSDGVCNAYIVDVWTHSAYRRQGIATQMMKIALEKLAGQHVYLFTDDMTDFYASLGFEPQPFGMGRVVGRWLENEPVS